MVRKVLLVDDDPDFHELIRPLLEQRGLGMHVAELGATAVERARTERFDLYIVDGLLPDTDGIDLIGHLRDAGVFAPIVFLSSQGAEQWGSGRIARLTRERNVALVLQKPIVPSIFMVQLESLLAHGTPWPGPPSVARARPAKAGDAPAAQPPADYSKMLPKKLRDLSRAIDDAYTHDGDIALLVEARTQAHRLRGTAGSYGYREIGESAGRIEEALVALSESQGSTRGGLWQAIKSALREVNQAATGRAIRAIRPPVAVRTSRVLVVDDDPPFIQQVEKFARTQLVDAVCARTPAEALDRAGAGPLSAALIAVPETSGAGAFALAHQLRGLPGYERLPIAFISASNDLSDRVAAAHAGAALFLTKPLSNEAFAGAVQQLLAQNSASQPRVLVVDDDTDFTADIEQILTREGMRVYVLNDSAAVLEAIEDRHPDALLQDAQMPGIDGFDVCRALRANPLWQNLPILLVTSRITPESRVAAFQAGADDYLAKPLVTEELLGRLRVRIERTRMLRDRAERDGLTGLLLRRAFMEQLAPRVAESQRHLRPITVCLLDLDHFKKVNDEHGHLAGDRVLVGLGKLLARRFRLEDLRGRWGGEEFILAFPNESAHTIRGVLERVLTEFSALAFEGDRGEPLSATFSAGVASAPADGASEDLLIRTADRRLYEAKRLGRKRVVHEG